MVTFVNSTYFHYYVNTGGGSGPQGYLHCVNGVVYVVVTSNSIEFIGSTSYTVNVPFQTLVQVQTANYGSDNLTGGKVNLTIVE
jgi:hypothetical protein